MCFQKVMVLLPITPNSQAKGTCLGVWSIVRRSGLAWHREKTAESSSNPPTCPGTSTGTMARRSESKWRVGRRSGARAAPAPALWEHHSEPPPRTRALHPGFVYMDVSQAHTSQHERSPCFAPFCVYCKDRNLPSPAAQGGAPCSSFTSSPLYPRPCAKRLFSSTHRASS